MHTSLKIGDTDLTWTNLEITLKCCAWTQFIHILKILCQNLIYVKRKLFDLIGNKDHKLEIRTPSNQIWKISGH